MTQAAEDLALSGTFAISKSRNVKFSKGNLRATLDNGTVTSWSFAPTQDAYVGETDANNLKSTTGTIDLFGWSTDEGYEWGIGALTSDYANFRGHWRDWGVNPDLIRDLGSGWFTMTRSEWSYLFNGRPGATVGATSGVRHYIAYINTDDDGNGGVLGLLLLPDGGTFEADEAITWGTVNPNSSGNQATKCTTAQWNSLEAKGAVFLTTAGHLIPSWKVIYNCGETGTYWSATEDDVISTGGWGSITVTIGDVETELNPDAYVAAVYLMSSGSLDVSYTNNTNMKIIRNSVRLVRKAE
jgi:hypothetical protein